MFEAVFFGGREALKRLRANTVVLYFFEAALERTWGTQHKSAAILMLEIYFFRNKFKGVGLIWGAFREKKKKDVGSHFLADHYFEAPDFPSKCRHT